MSASGVCAGGVCTSGICVCSVLVLVKDVLDLGLDAWICVSMLMWLSGGFGMTHPQRL